MLPRTPKRGSLTMHDCLLFPLLRAQLLCSCDRSARRMCSAVYLPQSLPSGKSDLYRSKQWWWTWDDDMPFCSPSSQFPCLCRMWTRTLVNFSTNTRLICLLFGCWLVSSAIHQFQSGTSITRRLIHMYVYLFSWPCEKKYGGNE